MTRVLNLLKWQFFTVCPEGRRSSRKNARVLRAAFYQNLHRVSGHTSTPLDGALFKKDLLLRARAAPALEIHEKRVRPSAMRANDTLIRHRFTQFGPDWGPERLERAVLTSSARARYIWTRGEEDGPDSLLTPGILIILS